uniref:antizyme inhibitor 2-like n=1 Tax=Styela clava TaxID=7725 RepID=UPI0019392A78|nr:antizyme inhibitor 2-like [Styela clava]
MENGVKIFVFDHETELLKMKKHYPAADLLLRIETDDVTAHFPLSDRFGAPMTQTRDLMKMAKELQMNIIGICFHPGSGINSVETYSKAIRDSKELFEFAKTLGMDFTILDIGGGFPAVPKSKLSFEEISACVNENLDKYFPVEEYGNLEIIAEPGRYYSSTAFTLATSVLSKFEPKHKADVDIEYVLGDGVHGSLKYYSDLMPGEGEPFVVKGSANPVMHYARLTGPTCDGDDVLAKKLLVPEMDAGDWLLWKNAGAYTFCFTTGFNGFKANDFYNIISKENEEEFWELVNNITRVQKTPKAIHNHCNE